ncbi:MAG: alpha/beta fold hydrolase [Hyphomicrobiales bacterium]
MTEARGSPVPIRFDEGGAGAPTLVLLHGLGVNAAAWHGFMALVEAHWPGRWIAPDLRGHGRSGHRAPYGYGVHAADVAGLLAQDDEVVVIGHSMGGVVAMALASGWFGVTVRAALAFGVKIAWTGDEVAKLKQIAAAPARLFESREAAVERYLLVSGMSGLVDPGSAVALSGVAVAEGGYRLAADPAINAAAGPGVAGFYRAADAPVRLAAGAGDPMVSLEDMRALDPDAVVIDGAGHNLHLEKPGALWKLLEEML